MTRSRSEREHDDEVAEEQRLTAILAARIRRATRNAAKDLQEMALKILDTSTATGGFTSRQEAMDYLRGYIEPKDRAVLLDAAYALPEPDRTRMLTRLSSPAYNWRITRTQAIDRIQTMTATRLEAEITEAVRPALERTVKESVKRSQFSVQREIGLGYRFDLPNERGIDEVLRGTGVYDKVKLFSKEEMEGVKETITRGMLTGSKPETIARNISLQTGKSVYKARRLSRTTIAQASVDAKVKEYRDLGIDEYEIVCTLDEKTCPVCRQYDGKRYRLGDGPMPTFHPNCRCGIRQVIPDEFRSSMRRAARDIDGRGITVPYDMTYAEWDERYGTAAKRRTLLYLE